MNILEDQKGMMQSVRLMNSLEDIEDAILLIDQKADIWQNAIIKVMLRAIYNLLVVQIKRGG